MKKMKITELLIIFSNSPGNQLIERGVIEGDFSLINPMLFTYQKSLDRQKSDYIFKVEYNDKITYRFNLDKNNIERVKTLIPDLKTSL